MWGLKRPESPIAAYRDIFEKTQAPFDIPPKVKEGHERTGF